MRHGVLKFSTPVAFCIVFDYCYLSLCGYIVGIDLQ